MPDYSNLPVVSSKSSGKDYSALPVVSSGPALSDSEGLGAIMGELGRFATLGTIDEISAGIRSLLPGFQDYDSELAAIRSGQEQYRKEFPKTSLALNLVGGTPLAMATGGSTMPESALAAGGRAALQGALLGGAQGFGEGQGVNNRLSGAALGGGIGGLTGGILGYGSTKLIDILSSPGAQQTASGMVSRLASERGAVGSAGQAAENIPVEYGVMANRLRATPIQQTEQAAANIAEAAADGSPMWVPEAFPVPSRNMSRLVRGLAQDEVTMDPIAQAVAGRQAGALERVSGILDEMHPERSAVRAGTELKGAIQGVKSELEAARREVASPIYQELNSKVLKSKAVKEVIKHPRIQKAIAAVRREFPDLEELPDTAFPVLDKVKQHLYNSTKGKPNIKVYANNARHRLVSAMDKDKALLDEAGESLYAQARGLWEEGSTPITKIFGEKNAPLVELSRTKPEEAGMRALGFNKEVIANIKQALGKRGEALVKSVRSGLQGKIEGMKFNKNLVSDIVDVPAMRDKLRTIIGNDAKFERLMKLLGRESHYAEGARLYHPGSSTYGNIQEAQNLSEAIPFLAKILTNPIKTAKEGISEAVSGMFAPKMNEQTMLRLARVLTDTEEGVKFFQTMLPYMRQGAAVRESLTPLSRALSGTTAEAAPVLIANPGR